MSSSAARRCSAKKRAYRLGRRAEKQEQTRQRIVEAAVELHGTIGPAHTSIAQIAERAGVQRHTFYAHFPDERSLSLACSGLALERDPLPDVEQWATVPPGAARIRHALEQIYAWYGRNEQLTVCVLRDAEVHELTREIAEMRMGPTFSRATELLSQGLASRSRALLGLALDFGCWRALHRTVGSNVEAAALMTDAILRVS
jgi:AcrR family transcriptional regulator